MPDNIFRGDAPEVSQVWTVTPLEVETGDLFRLLINGKPVEFLATEDTASNVCDGLAAAIDESDIPEFSELTAVSADGVLTLTAADPGVPFIVTTDTEESEASKVTIVETTPGAESTNEVQRIRLLGTPAGGTFTLTYDFGSGNETTAAIAYDATAAAVEAAIEALASVTAGDLTVIKTDTFEWQVTWGGTFEASEVPEGTVDGASLTGAGAAVVTTVREGRGLSNEVQYLRISTSDTSDYFAQFSFAGELFTFEDVVPTAALLTTKLEALSAIGAGNVAVYGGQQVADSRYSFAIVFQGDLAGTNVAQISADSAINASVLTSVVSSGGQATSNEIQLIHLGSPTGGSFTVNVAGSTTAPINYNASGATVEAAISALASVDTVRVNRAESGSLDSQLPLIYGFYIVEFTGTSADTEIDLMTFVNQSLTGSTGASISRVRIGEASVNAQFSLVIAGTGGTYTLGDGTDTSSAIAYNANAATVESEIESDLGEYPGVTVTGTGTPTDPFLIEVTSPAATSVPTLIGTGTSLTGGDGDVTEITSHNAGTDEVQTLTLNATSGTFRIGLDGDYTAGLPFDVAAAALEDALETIAAIGTGNVSVSGSGPYVITFQSELADTPINLLDVDGANLVAGPGDESLDIFEVTRSQGSRHFNDPHNWTLSRVPEWGDTVIFEDGETDCLFGLDQVRDFTVNAVADTLTIADHPFVSGQKVRVITTTTLPAGLSAATNYFVIPIDKDTIQLSATLGGSPVNITDAGTGTHTVGIGVEAFDHMGRCRSQIGLPRRNALEYYEYRPRFLKLWTTGTDKQAVIGQGVGPSAGRINLDFAGNEIHLIQERSGASNEQGVPAVQLKDTHADSTILLIDGQLGLAVSRGETATFDTLTQRGGQLITGKGHINGNIVRTGGTWTALGSTISGSVTSPG